MRSQTIARTEDVSIDELAHVHRRYIDATALRAACARVTNATLALRNPEIWGPVGTTCASDSTKFGAWDRNLMTEWHARYGGRGVMIYWHVERKAACIYSQLKRCSSSEVAAMIEGVLRHCTDWKSSASMSIPTAEAVGSLCTSSRLRNWPRGSSDRGQKLMLHRQPACELPNLHLFWGL